MPAYRSSAEADIREAVVARIREHRPAARIIHEIVTRDINTNRIDVLAVSRAEIIAVEIKSERDKLDRLPDQIKAMSRCSHRAIAAIHEKFLVEKESNQWAAHYERDGRFYMGAVPKQADGAEAWVFPERVRAINPERRDYDWLSRWRFPSTALNMAVPPNALCLLWRDELAMLCFALRVSVGSRATVSDLSAALRWHCTGKELTLGICRLLRARECCEADAPIVEAAA